MDANGISIFEGDIVSYTSASLSKLVVECVVKWDGGGFELWNDETYIDRLDKYSAPIYTVIGNVYDNLKMNEGKESK